MAITDALRDYVTTKIAKMDRFTDHIVDVHVTLDSQRAMKTVNIDIHFERFDAKVHAEADDMYAAIDLATGKLKVLLSRWHERIRQHHAKTHEERQMEVSVYKNPVDEFNEEIDAENAKRFQLHEVIRREKKPLKTLMLSEAIMKMELSSNPFMIFKGEEDQKVKVIYRLPDGNFGVVEPV